MDKQLDLARIANVIKAADVDVVAVQEVDIRTRRSGTDVDQLAELAKLTGMHGRFGKGRDYDGGEYGQAILSRQPIKELDVHKLPGDNAPGGAHRTARARSSSPSPCPTCCSSAPTCTTSASTTACRRRRRSTGC